MKHIIIVAVLAALAAYAYGVVKYHGTAPVPGYKVVSLDLRPAADPKSGKSFLNDLARERYLAVPKDGEKINCAATLTEDDFAKMAARSPEQRQVIDQSALLEFAAKRLHFRDDVVANGHQYHGRRPGKDGQPAAMTGDPITIEAAWDLALGGVARLPVDGHGETVAVQPGTMLMIILIFLGLFCALKIILYDPLLKIMDERDAEIAAGTASQRANAAKAAAIEARRNEKRAALRREYQHELSAARYEVQKVADGVVRAARDEARKASDENSRAIAEAAAEAKAQLAGAAPALGAEIANRVLGLTEGGKS